MFTASLNASIDHHSIRKDLAKQKFGVLGTLARDRTLYDLLRSVEPEVPDFLRESYQTRLDSQKEWVDKGKRLIKVLSTYVSDSHARANDISGKASVTPIFSLHANGTVTITDPQTKQSEDLTRQVREYVLPLHDSRLRSEFRLSDCPDTTQERAGELIR
jgi:hypothetical protein